MEQKDLNETSKAESAVDHDVVGHGWNNRLCAWAWLPAGAGENTLIRWIRIVIRILIILVREFHRNNLTLRARALTYTVVLSMVPMLALGTSVLKGFGAGDQMRQAAYGFLAQIEAASSPAVQGSRDEPGDGGREDHVQDTDAEAEESSAYTMVPHLRRALDQIFDYVEKTNFATLGAFGLLGLVIAVVMVFSSVEDAMNIIWVTESGRPLGRKIMDYLALMILFPVSINVGFAATALIHSPVLLSKISIILPFPEMIDLLLKMIPVSVLVAVFTIFYRFLPNTRVQIRPALVGGIFGGVVWLLVQTLYVLLQIGVSRYNAIYGSFATLPLFLVWIYVGWIVFLTGAEVAYACQSWQRYVPAGSRVVPFTRLALAFDILRTVYEAFNRRSKTTLSQIAACLNISEVRIKEMVSELDRAGLVRCVENGTGSITPAAPAEQILMAEVFDAIIGSDSQTTPGARIACKAASGAKKALGTWTLREVMTITGKDDFSETIRDFSEKGKKL
ncbi:MAG TPA: YihY family inner membrane protein [Thermodesulfobacteriaceae bacterium]|nr:YihY family inner membrane protein [Thermodesulfobacteriaceae bacterium]